MKQLLISAIFVVIATLTTQAQDRIITWNNDTINCKITSNQGRYIRFKVNQKGASTRGKIDHLKARQILYAEDHIHELSTPNMLTNRFRISLDCGSGLLIGSDENGRKSLAKMGWTPSQVDNYFNQIEVGWQAKARAHYFVSNEMGLGLVYRYHQSDANEFVTIDPNDQNQLYHGQILEHMYINFIGVSMLYQYKVSKNGKLQFTMTLDAGLTLYRDEMTLLESGSLTTGKAYGSSADFGLEYFVLPHVSVGLDANVFLSTIRKVKYQTADTAASQKLDNDNLQGLNSLDLLCGLKFYF